MDQPVNSCMVCPFLVLFAQLVIAVLLTILRFVDFLLIMKLAKEGFNVGCKALMKLLFSKRVEQPYIRL